MKTDLFQSCGHCWVFQICWHIEGSTFTASSFSIWNSSTGIPSPPLALFVALLPKCHLLLIPGCQALGEWSHHHSYLGREDLFCSSSVYSSHLFLISSASVRSLPFLSFVVPIFAWNVPLVSLIFLKRSLVFPTLLFSCISLHWSLRKAFLFLLIILWNSNQMDISFLFSFDNVTQNQKEKHSIPHFLKVHFMPLDFYQRPTLTPVFTHRRKSEEDFYI